MRVEVGPLLRKLRETGEAATFTRHDLEQLETWVRYPLQAPAAESLEKVHCKAEHGDGCKSNSCNSCHWCRRVPWRARARITGCAAAAAGSGPRSPRRFAHPQPRHPRAGRS